MANKTEEPMILTDSSSYGLGIYNKLPQNGKFAACGRV
jgi:hypothetical protein